MRAAQNPDRSVARQLTSLLACGVLLCSCAAAPKPVSPPAPPKPVNTVVLLPDSDGKTGALLSSSGGGHGEATDNATFRANGAVLVSGAGGGERLLSKPGQAVRVEAGSPPGESFIMQEGELHAMRRATRAALPKAPIQYLIYFEKGTADLTKESRGMMRDVLRSIKERGAVDISVVGHTDTVGDKNFNYQLSMKRAQAITALLAAEGIDLSVIETTSHGKDNPLIPTVDQVDEPRNRRVEVTIR